MNNKHKVFLIRGVLLGLVFGSIAYWLRDWQVGASIFLAQFLFQIAMLYIFPNLQRKNPLHLFSGFLVLVCILALVGFFYLQVKY